MNRSIAKVLARELGMVAAYALVIATLNFLLLQLVPGDLADVIAGESGAATPEYMERLRAQFGLDQPILVQLGNYVWQLVQLNLGYSFRHNMPVSELLIERLGPTLLLMGTSLFLAVFTGILLGVLSTRKINGFLDTTIAVFALVAFATPIFWTGMMAIVLFSATLGWLPSGGFEMIGSGLTGFQRALDIGKHMVMPMLSLFLFFTAAYTRLMRASMLEVLGQDYVTTARAKGLSESVVIFKHALRNALLPIVTMIGLQMGALIGGSVLVETVFSWPGIGRLAFEAVFQRDLNVLLGILYLSSLVVLLSNVLVDFAYALLDPRIEVAK
ncbi:ABC transporter, permease protein 1 (cluster 5, nickel/peptides/opines) (plasmid) [Cupriavidus necator H850]|uniref:ABC transporter permease n=1 Tax=Cupriavidus necator TaxID=106590 RepID=UPI00129D435D|nr:ABC transporter permease [Cupriavidus necator]KAI3610305.1 ABC transporter, permease protein 1 (cluster 5, nickel/peptides/opines) [Cupriavidus necator H850]